MHRFKQGCLVMEKFQRVGMRPVVISSAKRVRNSSARVEEFDSSIGSNLSVINRLFSNFNRNPLVSVRLTIIQSRPLTPDNQDKSNRLVWLQRVFPAQCRCRDHPQLRHKSNHRYDKPIWAWLWCQIRLSNLRRRSSFQITLRSSCLDAACRGLMVETKFSQIKAGDCAINNAPFACHHHPVSLMRPTNHEGCDGIVVARETQLI